MADANTLKVKILEKEYLVSCPDDQQNALETAAQHLDTKMREIRSSGKVHGIERITVMAALNITYELFESSRDAEEDKALLESLESKMEQVLNKSKE